MIHFAMDIALEGQILDRKSCSLLFKIQKQTKTEFLCKKKYFFKIHTYFSKSPKKEDKIGRWVFNKYNVIFKMGI